MILDLGLAVRLVVGIRTHTAQRTACQPWDAAGVSAALKATEGSPGAVLAAAVLAAEDPSCRTPNASTFAAHWPVNAASTRPAPRHAMTCPEHPDQTQPCQPCKADATPMPDEVRAALADAIAKGQAAIPHTRREPLRPKAALSPKETRR